MIGDKRLHRNKLLRFVVFSIIKKIDIDIFIRHHWTDDKFMLNLFRHKGYWYHGKNREKFEMIAIKSLVNSGDIVAEVGGHIGYLSLWLLKCSTNTSGKLFVFEPGINNLPYLKGNLNNSGAVIIESGCGEKNENLEFYMDNLSGQNNSFVKDLSLLSENAQMAPGVDVKVTSAIISVIRLDTYFTDIQPDFIKIDTEGYEYSVLKGAEGLFYPGKKPPIFMIEVQFNKEEIFKLLTSHGYSIFGPSSKQILNTVDMTQNLFALHPQYHADKIEHWKSTVNA